MDMATAIRSRILGLCGECGVTINKLSTLSALPPSSIKHSVWKESEPQFDYNQDDLWMAWTSQ